MKKSLLSIAILFSFSVKAQKISFVSNPSTVTIVARVNANSDTLIVTYSPTIRFIKFGDRVYEIVQPSLKEVEKYQTPRLGTSWPNYNGIFTPATGITQDSTKIFNVLSY